MTQAAGTIARAMVLAAGHGKRMRPLTEAMPKPLIAVGGQSMIERVLDRLAAAGVEEAVVNLHYMGEKIEERLNARRRPRLRFSREQKLLDTGGGVLSALEHLGPGAFFVVNGDIVWLDGATPALERLLGLWDETAMDALLLLHPTVSAVGIDSDGDFQMTGEGRLRRRREHEVAPFVFTGIQILHPRLFEPRPTEEVFSLNRLYDRAIEHGRLYGLRHDGEWFHIGTPAALEEVEQAICEIGFGGRP